MEEAQSGKTTSFKTKPWKPNYGLQAVLLPFWSDESVNKFLSTFLPSGASAQEGAYTWGPRDIEIAFAVDTRPGRTWSRRSNPYRNIKRILSTLTQSGKRIAVTVHLSFHAESESDLNLIKANIPAFKRFALQNISKSGVKINVCPSLEDWLDNNEFQKAVDLIVKQFQPDQLKKIGLRRNPDKSASAIKKSGFRESQIEKHGVAVCSNCQVWTPDGPFVSSEKDGEDRSSFSTEYGYIRFEDLLSMTKASSSKTYLLWRPAYNLWYKSKDARGKVKYHRSNQSSPNDKPIDKGSFDVTERNLLRSFLRKS